jgi:hypothetical protein
MNEELYKFRLREVRRYYKDGEILGKNNIENNSGRIGENKRNVEVIGR